MANAQAEAGNGEGDGAASSEPHSANSWTQFLIH
jgi:hypothetical protein